MLGSVARTGWKVSVNKSVYIESQRIWDEWLKWSNADKGNHEMGTLRIEFIGSPKKKLNSSLTSIFFSSVIKILKPIEDLCV